jgi:hypothetical protein
MSAGLPAPPVPLTTVAEVMDGKVCDRRQDADNQPAGLGSQLRPVCAACGHR